MTTKLDLVDLLGSGDYELVTVVRKKGETAPAVSLDPEGDDGFQTVDAKKKYTQSQLMRLALMRLHERRGDRGIGFPTFYTSEMQRIISAIDKKN